MRYIDVLSKFGTHTVVSLELGGRFGVRFTSSQDQYARYQGRSFKAGFELAGEYAGFQGKLQFGHQTQNEEARQMQKFVI